MSSCAHHDDCCQDCGRRYCCQSCGGQNFQENPNEPCTCDTIVTAHLPLNSMSSCARHDDCCHDCGRRYCCQSCSGQNFQENPNEPCTCDTIVTVHCHDYGDLITHTFNKTEFMDHIRTHTKDHPEIGKIHHLPTHTLDAPPTNHFEYDLTQGGWFMSTDLDQLLNYSTFILENGIEYKNDFYGSLLCFKEEHDVSGVPDKVVGCMSTLIRKLCAQDYLDAAAEEEDDE